MSRFPKKEADIAALAEPLWRGLLSNISIYPKPPIHPIALRMKSLVYKNRCEVLLAKKANAETATTAKDDALEDLIKALKSNILYAENTVNFDDAKLKLIGWAGRKTATALTAPGQSRLLESPKQGEGWVFLDWKAPDAGARAYEMEWYSDSAMTQRVGNVSTTVSEYEILGLTAGQQYWVRVRSFSGTEKGQWSDIATFMANL